MLKSNKQFLDEIKKSTGNEYTFLEKYAGTRIKIKVIHNICGHIYSVSPNKFLSLKRRCPKCSGLIKKTTEIFSKEVTDLTNDEYELCSEYINNKKKVKIRHKVCGTLFYAAPNDFGPGGDRCPECKKKIMASYKQKDHDTFVKDFNLRSNGNYTLRSIYTGYKDKINIIHHTCNREFTMTPNSFLNGQNCPMCAREQVESRPVREIENFLINQNILYEKEKTFPDCIHIRPLRFDFYLPELKILLEFDGQQHFKGWGSNLTGLNTSRKRDLIKDNYAASRDDLILFRIDYKDNHLNILSKIVDNVQRLSLMGVDYKQMVVEMENILN
jgi:uncharacterized protein with PIN domain